MYKKKVVYKSRYNSSVKREMYRFLFHVFLADSTQVGVWKKLVEFVACIMLLTNDFRNFRYPQHSSNFSRMRRVWSVYNKSQVSGYPSTSLACVRCVRLKSVTEFRQPSIGPMLASIGPIMVVSYSGIFVFMKQIPKSYNRYIFRSYEQYSIITIDLHQESILCSGVCDLILEYLISY